MGLEESLSLTSGEVSEVNLAIVGKSIGEVTRSPAVTEFCPQRT